MPTQMRMTVPRPSQIVQHVQVAVVQMFNTTDRPEEGPRGSGSETKDGPPGTCLRTTGRSNEPPSLFGLVRRVICSCPMPGTIGLPWRTAKRKTAEMIDGLNAAGPTRLKMRPNGV